MSLYCTRNVLTRSLQLSRYFNGFPKPNLKLSIQHVVFGESLSRQIHLHAVKQKQHVARENEGADFTKLIKCIKQDDNKDFSVINGLLETESLESLSLEQRILLLQCCGKLLSNKTLDFRIGLCDAIWTKLELTRNITVDDYNAYLHICTENEVAIDHQSFIASMTCEPNSETYQLLLDNACERGDAQKSIELLAKMKEKNCPIDESIFNMLVLAHSISSGLQGSNGVLKTMRSAHISETSDTYWYLLRGLATRPDTSEFLETLGNVALDFNEDHFFRLLLTMGVNENQKLLPEVMRKLDMGTLPRNLYRDLEHLCIHLIYRGKAEVAVEIYCSLIEPIPEDRFGRILLEELLKTQPDVKTIISITKYLAAADKNPFALEDVTEIALRTGKMDVAWSLLEVFDALRSHYFWPFLLHAAKDHGENGVINTLQKMLKMNVQVDNETLKMYAIPYCDLSNPKQLLIRLQSLGLTVRQLLSPLLSILLRNGQISEANRLCADYNVILDGNMLVHPLALAWKATREVQPTVGVMKRMCESSVGPTDFVGRVLLRMLNLCQTDFDCNLYLNFVKALRKDTLRISTASSELLQHAVMGKNKCKIKAQINDALDDLLDISKKQVTGHILHPRDMNMEQLECHLIELTNKNMETRGTLRLLITEHGRLGNHKRVGELRQRFTEAGYKESAGMKAMYMQTYLQSGQLQMAVDMHDEITSRHASFKLDNYKIIDLATLMVKDGQFDAAEKLLIHSKSNITRGTSNIERNIWRLLDATKNPVEAHHLLGVLTENGYCQPTNIILGPVVRSHIKCNDIDGAVQFFGECAKNYNCTPLQLELMCAVIETQNERQLNKLLEATVVVHGTLNTHLSFAAALAERGMTNSLSKLLLDMKSFPRLDLQRRCERWINEGKILPLQTVVNAAYRLPPDVLDLNVVYMAIMRIYSSKNDCDGAVEFVKDIQEKEIILTKQLSAELHNLFKRCKYRVPETLLRGIS